jgi:RNA-directed DNA polymerase
MLNLTYDKQLASKLSISVDDLRGVCENADSYCEEWVLFDPAKPTKARDIVNPTGIYRTLQRRFFRRVMIPNLPPLPFAHGGVKRRSTRTNFSVHSRSAFAFRIDISDYFPSITQTRVYRLFEREFACTPDAAALCTRLCTYNHVLPQGFITSPLIANYVLRKVDNRIAILCNKRGLRYSRFVDDLIVSGDFNLERSGIPRLIKSILEGVGFQVNSKCGGGSLTNGFSITGICKTRKGTWSPERDFARELNRQLDDAEVLARGQPLAPDRPYYLPGQIRGRIQTVLNVNVPLGQALLKRYRRINWQAVTDSAHRLQLAISKKRLVRPSDTPVMETA